MVGENSNEKKMSNQIQRFLLFAFPSFCTLAVLFIVLVIWREGFIPDLIPVTLVSIAIIVTAILLVKKYYWICLPMIALGICIALQDDQFVGHILRLFGAYMILHYLACGVYVYKNRKKDGGTGHREDKALVAIVCITIFFAFSLLLFG